MLSALASSSYFAWLHDAQYLQLLVMSLLLPQCASSACGQVMPGLFHGQRKLTEDIACLQATALPCSAQQARSHKT